MKPFTILACAVLLWPASAAAQTLSAPSGDLLQPTARQYTLAELNHIEAIKRLKARYFRMLDTKNWQEWGKVFAPDAVLRVSGDNSITGWSRGPAEMMEIVGRDRIVEAVSRTHANTLTVHNGFMPEIEITSPTTARAIWQMQDRADTPSAQSHGWGHYEETYEIVDGLWRIKTLRLTRLRLEETRVTPPPQR